MNESKPGIMLTACVLGSKEGFPALRRGSSKPRTLQKSREAGSHGSECDRLMLSLTEAWATGLAGLGCAVMLHSAETPSLGT